MVAPGWAAKAVVRYSLKYGPLVFEAVKHGREPAERAVRRAIARQAERKHAFEHAKTLVDGSVLRTYHEGEPVWVVFSRDVPVTAYPTGAAEIATLLEHADLEQRIRPADIDQQRKLPKPSELPGKLSAVPAKLAALPRKIPGSPWHKADP